MMTFFKTKQGAFPTVPILAVIWLCVVIGLTVVLVRYTIEPGKAESPPIHWPETNALTLSHTGYTLLMFAHPKCPCTKASIGELEMLIANSQSLLSTYVIFVKPNGVDQEWTKTDLVHSAEQIDGVQTIIDSGGTLARLFGVETSGSTQLFDTHGTLLFEGGITISRGSLGSNPGLRSIEALVHGEKPEQIQTLAFGCSLFDLSCPVETTK